MKRLLIFLMAFSLFTACNNDKGANEKKADYREKDDYGSNEEQSDDKSRKDEDSENSDYTSNDSWSERDISKFNVECMSGFGENQEMGKKICPCALEKFQKKYASYSEVETKSSEAEGKRIGAQCKEELDITDNNNSNEDVDDDKSNYAVRGWPQVERDGFMTNCEKNAIKAGQSRLVAQSYCECMLDKMETLYPDINDAAKLTESQLDRVITKYRAKCLEEK